MRVLVKVLKYNAETGARVARFEATQEDPWNHAEEAYPPGKKVRAR
jgi:small subunit ribosomal protein S1